MSVARGHGAEVLFVTQGLAAHSFRGFASKRQLWEGMARFTDVLSSVARNEGVALCDAKPVLESRAAAELERDGDQTIFTDEVHLQDAGADLLARTIAASIVEGRLLVRE